MNTQTQIPDFAPLIRGALASDGCAWPRRRKAERGDLLLIPFPFTDLSAAKRRPVLALTASDSFGDFIALAVTSRPQPEHGLPIVASDLVSGSLPAASWIRTNRIVTLNDSLAVKSIGRVSERVVAAVERFCAYIGYHRRA